MHVVDEEQQCRELLATRDNAELRRLLDRVSGVAAGVGEADDLGLRRLRLQQEGGEVRGVDRMLDAAENFAAAGRDDGGGISLQRMAEGVIRGQEEPAVAAGLGQRLAGAMREHIGIVGHRNRVRRTGFAGQVGAGAAGIDQDCVLLFH